MLWLYSSLLHSDPSSWQGFISSVMKGTCQCTAVVYNPMIPLNPQTDESVNSTMCYIQKQSVKSGMRCATLTFDQPLYMKGYKIKREKQH